MHWTVKTPHGEDDGVISEKVAVGPGGALIFYDIDPAHPTIIYGPYAYRCAFPEED